MSLILEALRKSEAERRRGDAPDLRVELAPPPPAPRRAPPGWIFLGTFVTGLLAALLLWPRGDRAPTAAGDEAAVAAGDAVDALPRVDAAQPDDAGAPGLPGDAGLAAHPVATPFPEVERIEATVAEPAPDRPLAPPPMAQRAIDEEEAGTAASAAAPAAPAAPPARAPDNAGGLRINGLSSADRQRLPDLKLSLHMWNEDPARRFAVIDGQRRVEGDRVGDAVIVAIDREGVLLDLDGREVRVPLP